ncbi:MAG TPA: hypothetical protein VGT08_02580 [Terracidiphilus sp.]|nr:hypothetical protein [Terracidiphilus sp.]
MKSAKLLAVAMATFASLPLTMAQQADASAQQNASASVAGSQVNDSANAGASAQASSGKAQTSGSAESSLTANDSGRANASAYGAGEGSMEMRPVKGELEGKLDSKSSKPGDPVVLKTRQKMRTADGTEIPKGSRLLGHVTEVQAHGKGHAESRMGLEFDRAELKGGQSFAIHSMIQSIEPSASAVAATSMNDEEALSGPVGGGGQVGGGAIGGGHVGGGGLLGATAGGAARATGQVGSDLGSTAGGAMRTTSNATGDATGSLGRGVGGAAYGAGSLGARATGFPGVMLNGEASSSASGVLSGANKNIHLDSGTQMVLGIAAAR